jgi:hypothetical protein
MPNPQEEVMGRFKTIPHATGLSESADLAFQVAFILAASHGGRYQRRDEDSSPQSCGNGSL